MIEMIKDENRTRVASIKVIGVGGGGGNTVNSIIDSGYQGIDFIVANTDVQALEIAKAKCKVQLGVKSAKGLGTGANPELGKRAAEEDLDKLIQAVEGADIVFLAAGMGGGTGSGALPVVARALKEHGVLTIAIVTRPFAFEGKKRTQVAEEALENLRKEVDTLIVIPNQKLLEVVDYNVSMIDAFGMVNDILGRSVKGISDIIARPGHINVDFADVRAIMKDMGLAVMGTGTASGAERAKEAALQSISSPLLENMSIKGARGVLMNISGGPNLGLHEISEAASVIYQQADEDANIILGSVIDEAMGDEVTVTIIATGFNKEERHSVADDSSEPIVQVQPTKLDTTEQLVTQAEVKEETETPLRQAQDEREENCAEDCNEAAALRQAQGDREEGAGKQGACPIDKENLDVPTFMRKEAETSEQSENSE